jgi:uncharacterized membrane protein YfcA
MLTSHPAPSSSAASRYRRRLAAAWRGCLQPRDRAVLAACRAIAVAGYAAALLIPARFLAVVELSLLGLLVAIVTAAAWRRRHITAPRSTSPASRRRRAFARSRRDDPERHQP